jgi:multiple antibiotic resistance protein
VSWNKILFDFVTLWVVIDPLGTVPLFLSLTKELTPQKRRAVAIRAITIAFFILAGFLYLGQFVLEAMRIELPSFQIAGGIVLFLFALSMIFANSSVNRAPAEDEHDLAIFPLAMPSIATPGALLSVVLLTDNAHNTLLQQTVTCGVMALVLALTLGLLLMGNRIIAWIGQSGANIMSRVMGMILAAVAVQMVYAAIKELVHG